jgi:hypothetical protein
MPPACRVRLRGRGCDGDGGGGVHQVDHRRRRARGREFGDHLCELDRTRALAADFRRQDEAQESAGPQCCHRLVWENPSGVDLLSMGGGDVDDLVQCLRRLHY